MGILEKVLGIFFTNVCPICGKTMKFSAEGMCYECKGKVKYVREPRCGKCGRPLYNMDEILCGGCLKRRHEFETGICIFEHSGEVRKSIYDFKYGNRRNYGDFYGREAARIYGRILKKWKIDVIVPVPIHREREQKRGYNQALVFAEAVAKHTGIKLERKLLIRKKKTVPQKELTETMRYLNLKNAFAVDRSRMSGIKNILVVDDIFTTGSTVDACSGVLKKAGAQKVYVLCVSAGVAI